MQAIISSRFHHTGQCYLVTLCVLSATALFANGQDTDDPETWNQFVNRTTIVVAKLDTDKLANEPWEQIEERLTPKTRERFSRWSKMHRTKLQALQTAVGGRSIYIAVDVPYTAAQPPLRIYLPRSDSNTERLLRSLVGLKEENIQVEGDYVLVTPGKRASVNSDLIEALWANDLNATVTKHPYSQQLASEPRHELNEALTAMSDGAIQIAILPPDYLTRTFRELLPELPGELGGGSTEILLDGAVWTAISIDFGTPDITVEIGSETPAAAAEFAESLPDILEHLTRLAQPEIDELVGDQRNPDQAIELDEKIDELIQPTVENDRIQIVLNRGKMESVMGISARLAESAFAPLMQQVTIDRFKQIMLAMHNYHSAYGSFPPEKNARNAAGESGLSWRVHLLPFLEERELFDQFRLDEPWDSDHNQRLIEKMPDIYRPPGILSNAAAMGPGHTVYLAPVGEGTIMGREEPTRFQDIIDGTSNTVMIVEVKPELAVPWTAPDDYDFDPQSPASGLVVDDQGEFIAAAADGAVHQIKASLSAETLLHIFQMADQNVVDWQ